MTLSLFTETLGGASGRGYICATLLDRTVSNSVPMDTVIGSTGYDLASWPTDLRRLTFSFKVTNYDIASGHRLVLALNVRSESANDLVFRYDHPLYPSFLAARHRHTPLGANSMRLRNPLQLFRDERGVALPVALAVLFVTAGLATVAARSAIVADHQSLRDRNAKRAIQAATSGLQDAVYQTNMLQPAANQCVVKNGPPQRGRRAGRRLVCRADRGPGRRRAVHAPGLAGGVRHGQRLRLRPAQRSSRPAPSTA